MDEGFLSFSVVSETFALPLFQVEEILEAPVAIPVPEAPHFVEGLVNLRGTILPLVNLYRRFGLRESREEGKQVIVVETQGTLVGLRVDEVKGILRAEELQIEPMPEVALTAVNREFLKGVGKKKEEGTEKSEGKERKDLIFIVDLERILSIQERKKLTQAPGESPRTREQKEEEKRAGLYISFSLEKQKWAVPIQYVGEVILLENVRPIPFTPPDFWGIVNLRGEVLWVVDIRRFLGLPKTVHSFRRAVVIQEKEIQVAFPIEENATLIAIDPESVLPALSTLEGVRADLVRGEVILKKEERGNGKKEERREEREVVILLDIPRILQHASHIISQAG